MDESRRIWRDRVVRWHKLEREMCRDPSSP
jgi:hypothetical protein